jgi:hypothetical protein
LKLVQEDMVHFQHLPLTDYDALLCDMNGSREESIEQMTCNRQEFTLFWRREICPRAADHAAEVTPQGL